MMVEDITILGVLDDFPQRFPTQKIMVVLMSIHPQVDMYGLMLTIEGALGFDIDISSHDDHFDVERMFFQKTLVLIENILVVTTAKEHNPPIPYGHVQDEDNIED
ncbi:hypothetical protein DEO72_LG8g1255 [Vigna unguiculata]|uniref:Uncharacterized protein n=1 Tax=Vigna unguiculata TaxID=3917 RepID=A0A4D6MRH8_VIGUN|nr:hypothetical protein DEO72_LG8g1254 [Vigna unguiculata]QCE03231.1 hypothetical protein DEO72_LG8g1255 [Vigna unguiculata]